MPPDQREVAQWLSKANHDRRLAEIALEDTPPITDGAAAPSRLQRYQRR
jgi:hypothetical protein